MAPFLGSVITINAHQVMLWSAVLAASVIALFLGVWYYRKRWLAAPETTDTAWTLEDLRRIREKNLISEEEYQRLRSALIGSLSKAEPKPTRKAQSAAEGDWDWVASEPDPKRIADSGAAGDPSGDGH